MKHILTGPAGSGKTSLLCEHCARLAGKPGIHGGSILVLLANNSQLAAWNSSMADKTMSKFRCCTFSAFVREELTVYYPVAAANCKEIVRKEIKPVFLTPEAAIHLISKVVQARREKDGLFRALVSSNERLAAVIVNNLAEAALEGIPASDIGNRLYAALERKDEDKKLIFENMDETALAYRKKCLELGVFDHGLAVDVYRRYVLPDEQYRQGLFKRIRHLVVDDLQECSFAEIELAGLLLETVDTGLFAYDPQYGSAELAHDSRRLIETKIAARCQPVELPEAPDNRKLKFSEALYTAMVSEEPGGMIACGINIERHPAAELRSEMLEQLASRVCSLIEEDGCKPSDIVILSTYGDIVTELVIGNILREKGIKLTNVFSRRNAADWTLCSALLTFARLCHPDFRLFPEKGAVKQMLELLFGMDPVRCGKIARKTCSKFPFPELPQPGEVFEGEEAAAKIKEKYNYIIDWVHEYKQQEKPYDISAFLQQSLLEVFLAETLDEKELEEAKYLVDAAERFGDSTARFNRNTGRDFIEMAEKLMKPAGNIFRTGDGWMDEQVLLTTPEAYLSSPGANKIIIMSGLSSRHWSTARARELTNRRVLSASWEAGAVFTSALEEQAARQYLAAMLGAVFNKCNGKLITFESVLSESGYENDGVLPDIFDRLS